MKAPQIEAAWERYRRETLLETFSPNTVVIAHAAFLAGASVVVGLCLRSEDVATGVGSWATVQDLRKELDTTSEQDLLARRDS